MSSQGVVLVSDATAFCQVQPRTRPIFADLAYLVGSAEVQCDSPRFLVKRAHSAVGTIGSGVLQND